MKERELFSYHFLAIALLAFLNCPDRSDFNLPLSIFAFILWNHKTHFQKHRILWLLLFSIVCDAVWILVVSVGEWTENTQGNRLRGLTQALSIVNLCYKAILLIYAVVSMDDCKSLFTLQAFRKNALYLEWSLKIILRNNPTKQSIILYLRK